MVVAVVVVVVVVLVVEVVVVVVAVLVVVVVVVVVLTAESRVSARVNPCGICGGQNDIETGFSPSSSSVSPANFIPPLFSTLIYHLEDE
jgi:hypothetical protein